VHRAQVPKRLIGTVLALGLVMLETLSATGKEIPVLVSSGPEIFPVEWQTHRVSATPLDAAESERAIRAIKFGLSKYPRQLLEKNLLAVYLVGELRFRGIAASGCNSDKCVYVKDKGLNFGFTDKYIEFTFHNELSSILLRNYSNLFPKADWLAANPPEFAYLGDGVKAVQSGVDSTVFDDRLAENGFLCQYAMASQEEDFNQIAGWLFVGNPRLWRLAGSRERLAKKLQLAVGFYHSIDSSFDEQYFRGLVAPVK
jgi:hypothetical protein